MCAAGDTFKGKKITIMGLGLLGRGIGDTRFFAKHGAEVLVTDLKTEEQLSTSLEVLREFPNITYVLGGHRLEDFRGRDLILKAAGVPLDSPYIAEARLAGIPIEMSTSLFASLTEAMVIGITGTRGKSTVTHLLYEVLKRGWKGGQVFLGGNVKGMSTIELLPQTKKGDVVVLELDSWQLQGFGERKLSPHLSIFTTFLNDHLNYYKGDLGLYYKDKANIYEFQKQGDIFIAGSQMADRIVSSPISPTIADEKTVPSDWELTMIGEHNRYNAGLVIAAARALGINDEIIKDTVMSFAGVPGRLEKIKTVQGIDFYNDTNSTTPDATIAALRALSFLGGSTVLIMGGADKNLDMSALVSELNGRIKNIVCLPGTGTDRLMKDPTFAALDPILATTLADAVTTAMEKAKTGDSILLSPAFASFGLFKNEYDRGDQFNSIVGNLYV